MERVGVGVIGCGNISAAYLKAARHFPILDLRAVADLEPGRRRSARRGVRDTGRHASTSCWPIRRSRSSSTSRCRRRMSTVGLQAIAAGKHVYSEKPLGITSPRRASSSTAAEARGLRVGCAPDTFLGGAHQTAGG